MQHENQPKPFLLDIQGLKPIDFGPVAPEPEADGFRTQPEDLEHPLDHIELFGAPEPTPTSVDVWEHSYGVEPDGYTATCDLWRWDDDSEPHAELAEQEVDAFANLP